MLDFKPFYLKNVQKVFGVVYSYLLNQEDAEEVTQDIFLKVSEKFNTFREESNVSTWLYRIAVNQSLDFIRRKERDKRVFQNTKNSGDIDLVAHISGSNNADLIIRREEVDLIYQKALEQLTEEQRAVFIMSNELNLSNEEISNIIDKPIGAITTIKHRAIKKLKEILFSKTGNNDNKKTSN